MAIPKIRAPIVLIHGLMGYDHIQIAPAWRWDYFRGIVHALTQAGNRVLVPRLSRTSGIERRARQLKEFLDQHAPGDAVHAIAHSMGGLDARYLITHLGMAHRVLSLTTIGTPHRGTPFADWGIKRFGPLVAPILNALRIPHDAFRDLTTSACRAFNERTPDMPNVRYFSVAGRCEKSWLTLPWLLPYSMVQRAEGANDGVVSVSSASHGEWTEMWRGDHLNLINVPNHRARHRGEWTDRTAHYANLVGRLTDYGF
jgi:triacylglycerol lipase